MEMLNCKKHGDYKIKVMDVMGKEFRVTKCSSCIVEEKEIEDKHKIEVSNRNIKRAKDEKRLNAGISKRNLYKGFDSYIASSDGQGKALNQCKKYVDNFPNVNNMLMLGSVGTGKTLLACSIIENLIDKHECWIRKAVDIFRDIKETYSNDNNLTEARVIKRLTKLPLLIIDEVGMQFNSEMEKLLIFDIIDGRYQNMLPTVLISNLDVDGITNVIGARCMDRLRDGGGSVIAFDWESARK